MTSLLARLGQLESRKAAHTIWSSGKKRRQDWVCAECRARRAVKQRRTYSDGTLRLDNPYFGLSRTRDDSEDVEYTAKSRIIARSEHGAPWGLNAEKATESRRRPQMRDSFFRQHQPAEEDISSSDPLSSDVQRKQADLWEEFESAEEGVDNISSSASTNDGVLEERVDNIPSIKKSSLLNLDYKSALTAAFEQGKADLVVRCLCAAAMNNDHEWLRSIPSTTFSDIIRLLDPSNFVAGLASAHLELSTAMVAQMGIAPMREVAYEYSTVLRQIVAIREAAGLVLTFEDYANLLKSARILGKRDMATQMFNSLLSEGFVPNTACYNHYMASVLWNGVHSAGTRHRVRIMPFHTLLRKQARLSTRLRNYEVGSEGLRETTTKIFSDMLARGATANEESFCILLTAAAREGDITIVKSLLKKIWNIDVESIVGGQDETTIVAKEVTKESPLYPTPTLLFAIAHAFSINNDIPAALRTVDFVARQYDLTIPQQVWNQLFEWTFVMSVPRWGSRNIRDGSMTGQIPMESVERLWDAMTGPPYHIQPSMGMYNYFIKNLAYQKAPTKLVDIMNRAMQLYEQHRQEANQQWKRWKLERNRGRAREEHTRMEEVRKAWEYADLIRQRDLFWIKRWLRLFMTCLADPSMTQKKQDLYYRSFPNLLWTWRGLAPTTIRYELPTGFVDFNVRDKDEVKDYANAKRTRQEYIQGIAEISKRYVGNEWLRAPEKAAKPFAKFRWSSTS